MKTTMILSPSMEKLKRKSAIVFIFFLFFDGAIAHQYAFEEENLFEIAGYGEEKLSSVIIFGRVTCSGKYSMITDTTPQVAVPGAEISVACKNVLWKRKNKYSWIHGTTDEYGEFIVDLPSELHGIPSLEKACVVKIRRLPKEHSSVCGHTVKRRRRRRRRTRIQLSSARNNVRFYTAGTISL